MLGPREYLFHCHAALFRRVPLPQSIRRQQSADLFHEFFQLLIPSEGYSDVEIGGGHITGTEYSPEHPEGISFGMYHRLSAARASGRNDLLSGVAVPIQIFLHMGNNLVPLAHLDAAARCQLQILNEGEVVEARSGYRAAVDLHRVKDRHRCDFPCAAGRPFNRTQDGFIGVVLKLERKPVLIVMPGPAAGFCVSYSEPMDLWIVMA